MIEIQATKWDCYTAAKKARAVIGDAPGGMMLRRLEAFHPTPIEREDLMKIAGISVTKMGGVSAYASFHYKIERVNDELHKFGWEIGRMSLAQETYALVKSGRGRDELF